MKHNKVLYLVRHAKSDWGGPTVSDQDRPLNNRGRKDAPKMGNRLRSRVASPGLIVTSPAIRAQTTAILIATELDFPIADIVANTQIYEARLAELLTTIRAIDNQYRQVMLVGHNPGVTDLVNHLTGYLTDSLPTCSITTLEFETDDWDTIERVEATLLDFDFPKKY